MTTAWMNSSTTFFHEAETNDPSLSARPAHAIHMKNDAKPHPMLYPNASVMLGPRLFAATYKGVREEGNHLLALDEHRRPIPHTYLGEIEALPPLSEFAATHPIHELDEGFLFYSTPWHTNFQHFLTETFPKVVDYLALIRERERAVPLLVPDFMHNAFVTEILGILGLKSSVVPLASPCLYRINHLYSSSYVPNYDPPTPGMIRAFRLLGDAVRATRRTNETPPSRRIYLGRDKSRNPNQNNANDGARRIVVNEAAIQRVLDDHGFETALLGSLNLPEKRAALAGAEILVSPIGANLMNLLFLSPPHPRRVIILHSSHLAFHARYFKELLHAVFAGSVPVDLFEGPSQRHEENSPYELDPWALECHLRSLLNDWGSRMFPMQPAAVS